MPDRILVQIVDDDEAVRESTKLVLEVSGFVCTAYSSAREFLDAGKLTSGCALVDVRMPGMDGLALLSELSARKSSLPVIIMTGFADVPLAVKAMKAGAVDFVEKPTPPDVLVDAVRRACDRARSADAERREAEARFQRLTQRETEVLKLLVAGDPNKIVAHKLGISPRTVEIHRGRLMEKAQAKNLADLVRMALAAGIGRER
jgi:two-component system, LuxR family, response regulator FixJ